MKGHLMNVALADDHALMRMAIKDLLQRSGLQVTCEAEDFASLTVALQQHHVDVVICDCKMAGMGASNFMSWVKQHLNHVKVIFLSALESSELFSHLLKLGANGIASKKSDIQDIVTAITQVSSKPFISGNLQAHLTHSTTQLTTKEFQVFELVVQGLSNNDIAKQLHRSPSTVNTHRVSLMQKLNAHSVVELVHIAHKNGLFVD